MFRKSFILFVIASLASLSVVYGQTQPPSGPPNDTLRYIDKIPHWLGVHQLTALDFMKVQRSQFKASTYIETYVDAMIDHPAWMFPLLNQFTALRNSGFRNTPHVIFTVRFRPVDDAFSSYEVSVGVMGSPQIPLNFNGIAQSANFIGLNGRRFLSPQDASDEVEQAITEAMRLISRGVGNSLSPNLMVKFNNEVFWNGHEILIGKNGNDQFTLQPLAKFGRRLTSEQVSWTNATGGLVDMAGQNSKTITLTRLDTAASLTVTVKRRSGLGVDLKSILRPIFMQIVQEKLTRMLDSLVNMRVDSVQNANELTDLVSQLEAQNVALEPVGTFVPLFTEPITLTDESGFRETDTGVKARSFRALHKRKNLTQVLRTKVNVAAFLDILMRQPDKVDELLDALILNSGTLLGELVLNIGDPNVLQTSRNLILTYLNRNLVNISGSYFGQAPDEPINVRRVVSASSPKFNPAVKLYISNHVDFPGKAEFKAEMETYLNTLSPPLYVFVNYSQDISTETYLARSNGVRPVGLPEGARFVTFTVLNVPGSVKEQLFAGGITQQLKVSGSNSKDVISNFLRDPATLEALSSWCETRRPDGVGKEGTLQIVQGTTPRGAPCEKRWLFHEGSPSKLFEDRGWYVEADYFEKINDLIETICWLQRDLFYGEGVRDWVIDQGIAADEVKAKELEDFLFIHNVDDHFHENIQNGVLKHGKDYLRSQFGTGEVEPYQVEIEVILFITSGGGSSVLKAGGALRNIIKRSADRLAKRLLTKSIQSLDDLVLWASRNGLSHLKRTDLEDILKFVDNNYDFAKRIALSTKEIQPATTLSELAAKLKLPLNCTPKSLTPYQTRVWYSWRKAKIGDIIDKTKTLEIQARQAVNIRNEIRTGARQGMKDTDIADFLDTGEVNKTWEQLVREKIDKVFSVDDIYKEIINSSMKGRPVVDNIFKIPTVK